MLGRWRPLLVGLCTFVVGMLIFFPARVAYQWFAPPALVVGGISGSVWSGSAAEAAVAGVYLRNLRWRINAAALFSGDLSYSIAASPVNGFVEATVALSMAGTITVSDLSASLPLRAMESASGISGLDGTLSLRFQRLTITNGLLVAADGIAEIADLVVPVVHRGSIGGYRAEFFTGESGVTVSIEDTDGLIDLAGSLQLGPGSNYRFMGQLAAKPETPENVRQQMRFLPSTGKAGQYEFRLEGQL